MGDEYLRGLISGEDGTVVRQPNTGHGRDGRTVIGFNCVPGMPTWTCAETIELAVPKFDLRSRCANLRTRYQGNSAYINGGTGRFEYATGNITISGPYIVWATGGPRRSMDDTILR